MTKDPSPIDRERAPALPPRALAGLSVRCVFCHDALGRAEAVYCASCLAPHHGDCFADHGRCGAPGCGETTVVRRGGPVTHRRWGRVVVASIAALALGGVVGVVHGVDTRDPCVRDATYDAQVCAGGVKVSATVGHASALEVVEDPDTDSIRVNAIPSCPDGAHPPFQPTLVLFASRGETVSLEAGSGWWDVSPRPGERVVIEVVEQRLLVRRSSALRVPAAPDVSPPSPAPPPAGS